VFANPVPFKAQLEKAKAEPGNFPLQLQIGRHYSGSHQPEKAIPYLKRAVGNPQPEKAQEQFLATFYLARAYFESRKFSEALAAIDSLERLAPDSAHSAELRLFKARVLFSLRRYEESNQVLEPLLRAQNREDKVKAQKLIAQMPAKYRKADDQVNKLMDKAAKSFNQGKVEEAQELVKQAAEFSTLNPDVPMLQGLLQIRFARQEKDLEKRNQMLSTGLNYLRVARRLDPDNLITFLQSENVLASRWVPNQPGNQEAQKVYAQAEQAFVRENYGEAVKQYAKTIQLDPSFGKAYLHSGDCFFAAGQKEEALNWYLKAIETTPLDAAAYRFAADAMAKLGRKEEARQLLIRGLLSDPEYPLTWRDLANWGTVERHHQHVPLPIVMLALGTENYEEALFQNLPAETIPAWQEYVRQKLLWREGKFKETFPQSPFHHESCREESECLQQTTLQWQRMKEKNPALKNAELDYLLAVTVDEMLEAFIYLERFSEEYRLEYQQWRKDNPDQGREYLDRYVFSSDREGTTAEGHSRAAIAHFNAGYKEKAGGKVQTAILEYEKALRLEPDYAPALHNLSLIWVELRDWTNARNRLEKWRALAPEEATPLALLARTAYEQNQPEEALVLLQQAAEREKDLDRKKELMMQAAQLKSLQPANSPGSSPPPRNTAASVLRNAQEAIQADDPGTAIQLLRRALGTLQDPVEKDQVTFMLVFAYIEAKNVKSARAYLDLYLASHPGDQKALSLLDQLKALESEGQENGEDLLPAEEKPVLRRR
jgi:tetratricopeptide (TPR) repeat protein